MINGVPCNNANGGWNGNQQGYEYPLLGTMPNNFGGDAPGFQGYNSFLKMEPWSVGFPADNSDFSIAPNDKGHPDIVTILRYLGFDGTDPFNCKSISQFTLHPNNGGVWGPGSTMDNFNVDDTWSIKDLLTLVGAGWESNNGAGGSYQRTWTQPNYPNYSNGGSTNTVWWSISGQYLDQFVWEEAWNYCTCQAYGQCVCEEDPNGVYATKPDCENEPANCCYGGVSTQLAQVLIPAGNLAGIAPVGTGGITIYNPGGGGGTGQGSGTGGA